MKIAVIAPTYIPARRANTVQVMKMCQALAGLGHSVRLAVPGLPHPEEKDWGQLSHHYGLQMQFPVEWLPAHPRLRRYDFGLRAVRWARRWGAELVYTRLPQAAAGASLAGLPTILETHDLPQGKIGPLVFRLFLKGASARRLVVITRALAGDLARLGAPASPPFTLVAPDGVDLARYANLPDPEEARKLLSAGYHSDPDRTRPPLEIQRFTAGYTGHLYPGRGSGLLLELAERLPEITFLVAGGETQDINQLRAKAAAKGLANLVLAGFVANAELPAYQAACEVLLMPYQQRVSASSGGDISRYLSPMKLFEYMACQRAILSSDLPVLREVLSPQNAVLLPPADLQAWVTALQHLQAEPGQRLALARQACLDVTRYTWDERARKIMEGI
jgi:glycosyltransferase involved in cell wall biosynthesis